MASPWVEIEDHINIVHTNTRKTQSMSVSSSKQASMAVQTSGANFSGGVGASCSCRKSNTVNVAVGLTRSCVTVCPMACSA